MVVRCTSKLLNLLGKDAVLLIEALPSENDWYVNLLWVDRRKCLLAVHAGTIDTPSPQRDPVHVAASTQRRDLLGGLLHEYEAAA